MTRLRTRRGLAAPLTLAMTAGLALAGVMAGISTARVGSSASATDVPTATPIKHVVVIIGENHTFDNVFATYQPPADQHVLNLLSEGMVTPSGTPGPEMGKALQREASDTKTYQIDPRHTGTYRTLPQPNTTYVSQACDGQAQNAPDTRFPADLPNVPYQITKYVPYFDSHSAYTKSGKCEFNGAYVGDPLHRFYQM